MPRPEAAEYAAQPRSLSLRNARPKANPAAGMQRKVGTEKRSCSTPRVLAARGSVGRSWRVAADRIGAEGGRAEHPDRTCAKEHRPEPRTDSSAQRYGKGPTAKQR